MVNERLRISGLLGNSPPLNSRCSRSTACIMLAAPSSPISRSISETFFFLVTVLAPPLGTLGVCERRLGGDCELFNSASFEGVPVLLTAVTLRESFGVEGRTFLLANELGVIAVGVVVVAVDASIAVGVGVVPLAYCANDFCVSGASGSQMILRLITRVRLKPAR